MMKCIIVEDEELTRKIVETLVAKTASLQLVKSCSSAIEALEVLMEEKIDLIFLDIELPEMSGWELLKMIPEPRPQVVLITSNKENAKEAFDFNATDFILKPIAHERFLKAIAKVKKNNRNKIQIMPDEDMFIRVGSLMVKVNTRDILYIEALSDYVTLNTASSEKYTIHSTMKGIEGKLPTGLFMRVHNSFIIRMDRIRTIDQNLLTIDEKLIPISRANKAPLMQRLNIV